MNRQLASKILQYVLGLALGGVLLYTATDDVDLDKLLTDLQRVNVWWLVAALTVGMASHLLRAIAWRMQLRAAGYDPSLINTFSSILFMYAANQVMPRAGEVARCSILLKSDKIPLATSFGTAVASRVLDVLTLGLLIGVILLLERGTLLSFLAETAGNGSSTGPNFLLLGGLALAGVLALAAMWFWRRQLLQFHLVQRIKMFIIDLIKGAISIRNLNSPVLFVLTSVAVWFGYWASSYLFFFCFADTAALGVNLMYFSLLVTLMSGIGMLVPTPGGIGPYHQAVVFTFRIYLAPGLMTIEAAKQMGMTWAVVSHASQFFMLIFTGFLAYFFLVSRTPRDSKIVA